MTTTTTTPALALRAITAQPGRLSPPYYHKFNEYLLQLPADAQTFTLTLDAGDNLLEIAGQPAFSGQPSAPLPAPVGHSVVPFVLRSPDGLTSRAYQLVVRRAQPTPDWRCLTTSNPWPGRDSAGELVFDNHLWLFGGYTPKVIDDVWRSRDGVQWEQMPSVPQSGGFNIPIRFVLDGRMWLTGSNGSYLHSSDGMTWTCVEQPMPWAGRSTAGSVVHAGRAWILGGLQGGVRRNDVWSSADGINWRQETDAAPWSPRQLHDNVVSFAGKLWVLGGSIQRYHPMRVYRDVWCSADGIHWEEATPEAPWPGRNWGACAVYRNRLWVFSGFRSEAHWQNLNDVWYSSDGSHWQALETPNCWSPRHELSPYVHDERLWVVGGNAWPLLNDVWSLHLTGLTFLSQPDVEELVGAEYTYRPRADFHHSASPVRYRLLEHPTWLSFNEKTGLVRGRAAEAGAFPITIEAYDDAGETAQQHYTLHVLP